MLHYLHTRSCPTTREIFVVLIGALKSSPHMSLFFVFYLRKKQKQKENKQWADNPYKWMYGIGYTWTEMRSEDRMIQSRILY